MILDLIYIFISILIKGISVTIRKKSFAINSFEKLSKRYLDITHN